MQQRKGTKATELGEICLATYVWLLVRYHARQLKQRQLLRTVRISQHRQQLWDVRMERLAVVGVDLRQHPQQRVVTYKARSLEQVEDLET